MKKLYILIILLISILNSHAITDKYDKYFKRYTKIYLPSYNWKWFKAQSIAESSLNPKAKSYVGALGLMQVMPSTARWLGYSPEEMYVPELAIHAGIKYDYKLTKYWKHWTKGSLKDKELLYFTFASYNAGPGNVKKAWIHSGKINTWYHVKFCLPKITGRHAKETIGYVRRIKKWFIILQVDF